jgi:glycolate oxidase
MIASYDDMQVGLQAVSDIMASGVLPAKVEFVDNFVIQRMEEMFHLGLPVDAQMLLLIQTDGSPAAVAAETEQIITILKKHQPRLVRSAQDADEALLLWKARSAGFAAIYGASKNVFAEDVTVPRDRLVEFMGQLNKISKEKDMPILLLGHAGDGNLHPAVATDQRDKEHFARAMAAIDEIITAAMDLGGVLSGEHGVGLDKQRFLKRAMDPAALELMKQIKNLVDPHNIVNPGKIWEEETTDGD